MPTKDTKLEFFDKENDGIRVCLTGIPILNMSYKQEIVIEGYEILVPDKVIRVYFSDCSFEKMVCKSGDEFDLRRGLYLALAKHLYKKEFTVEGIEVKATELSYMKKYVNMVEKAIKKHDRLEKEKIEFAQKQKEEKKAKHDEMIKQNKKKRERKIEIQKEAYLRAMREIESEKENK